MVPSTATKRSTAAQKTAAKKATKARADKSSKKSAQASSKQPSAKLSAKELAEFHARMWLIRAFEEKVVELFQAGELAGFLHVAIGQEAIAVGVCEALREDDLIGSTHRAHGHILARGSDPTKMMAELLGRKGGYCQGKGGSMHIADMSHNVVGANGVVGAGVGMMGGVALAQQFRKTGNVSVAFFGDGSTNQGNVHEALNLAQLWKLPAIFVLENNRYAESTPLAQHSPVEDLAVRGIAYGMKTISVDGNDVLAVFDAATQARAHAASGKGPVLLVCETHRIVGHFVGDAQLYRPKGEVKEWRKDDPIPRFHDVAAKRGVPAKKLDDAEPHARQRIDEAVAEAHDMESPDPSDALLHVYSTDTYDGPVRNLPR